MSSFEKFVMNWRKCNGWIDYEWVAINFGKNTVGGTFIGDETDFFSKLCWKTLGDLKGINVLNGINCYCVCIHECRRHRKTETWNISVVWEIPLG